MATSFNWAGLAIMRELLFAAKTIIEKANAMFTVWDGKRAEGAGGTADIMVFAQKSGKPIIHLSPVASMQRI